VTKNNGPVAAPWFVTPTDRMKALRPGGIPMASIAGPSPSAWASATRRPALPDNDSPARTVVVAPAVVSGDQPAHTTGGRTGRIRWGKSAMGRTSTAGNRDTVSADTPLMSSPGCATVKRMRSAATSPTRCSPSASTT
jgi:hypothetical protein